MGNRARFSLLAAALVTVACTRQQRTIVFVPMPVPSDSPRLAISAAESDEDGHVHTLGNGPRAFVDVNSLVRITPHLSAAATPPDTSRLAALRHALDSASAALASAGNALATVSARVLAAQSGYQRTLLSNDPVATAGAKSEMSAAEASKVTILRTLRSTAKRADPQRYNSIMNTGGAAQDSSLAALAATAVAALLDSVNAETQQIRLESSYRVELSAVRYSAGRTPVQVHLPGYDNLTSGDPNTIDKLSFARTAEEQEQLDKTTAAIQTLIKNANGVSDVLRSVAEQSVAAADSVVGALAAIKDAIPALPPAADLKAFADSVSAIAGAGNAAGTQLNAALSSVRTQVTKLGSLREAVASAPEQLRQHPDLMAPFDMLDAWAKQARQIVGNLQPTLDSLSGAAKALQGAPDVSAALASLRNGLAPAQQQRLDAAAAGIVDHINPGVDRLDKAVKRLVAALAPLKAQAELFASLFPVTTVATHGSVTLRELVQVRATEAGPTTLDLVRTDRHDGDDVVLSLRMIDTRTSTNVDTPVEYTIGVREFGWYRRWAGGLAFARTLGRNLPDSEKTTRPGVSASWIVHFRRRPDNDGLLTRMAMIFGSKGVGLGLTSVLFTRDQSLQLGFGPTATLFGDLVQLGAGYNLQTQKWYGVLNTPLLELIQRAQGQNPP